MTQRPAPFRLGGGLDLATPAMLAAPGSAIGGVNYEPDEAGYRRFEGFERFDGRPKPSLATYATLPFDAGDTLVEAGDVVTGAVSGATGVAVVDHVVTSGDVSGGDAAGHLVLREVTGAFQDNEALQVSAATVATAAGTANPNGAETDADNTTWTALARAQRRAAIAAVPGQGPVRGVAVLSGAAYAVRDAVGGASAVLFKATASGWEAQSLGHYVAFTAGAVAAIAEGATLTQGGVTATIERVVIMSGSFSGGDAAGRLVLSGISGGAFASGAATSGDTTITLSAGAVAHALPPGGRYEFVTHNFRGAAGAGRLYGANGVGRGFEFDGAVFSWLWTGLGDALDKPQHVAEFASHLWLGYLAGSWLHSGIGEPLDWRTAAGAGEIAIGSEVTGWTRTASVLVCYARTRIDYISGTDATTFQLLPVSEDSGARRWTAQLADEPIYADDGAIRGLTATQALGGWRMGAKSRKIEKLMGLIRKRGAKPVASMRVRGRDLYRLLYDDGSGLSMHINGANPEIMPLDLPITAYCAWSSDGLDGADDTQLVGAVDGFVYEMDAGIDFDGAELDAMVRLAFFSDGRPRINKRWHSAHLEIDGGAQATIKVTAESSYGAPTNPPAEATDFSIRGSGGFWDTAIWDQFYWSAQVVGQGNARIDTAGANISLAIRSTSTGEPAHTLSVMTLHYTDRGLVRGDG